MAATTRASGPLVESRAQQGRLDWWLVFATLLLMVVGLMSLYSIDQGANGGRYFSKQLLRLAIGVVPFAVFYWVSPKALQRYSWVLYALNLAALVFVLVAGSSAGGAQRWLPLGPIEFQPSELSKLLTVVTLATYFASKDPSEMRHFKTYLVSLVHVGVPLVLIFLQPHLGASLALLMAWVGVSLTAGVRFRFLAGTVLAAIGVIVMAISIPGILKPYQIERILSLFGGDPKGSKFQHIQAQSAFAAGSLTGVGYLKGEQKGAGFVPEQQTDFIFTVIGEEGGLVGCVLLLAAFGLFFYRIWLVMYQSQSRFHQMMAAGVFSYLAFHTVVNIGMNLELLPVVGLWLPFMSFGGTAVWLCLASVGLVLNLRTRERPVLF